MSLGRVLSYCDLTGNMVRPWAEVGYECICYDTQHKQRSDKTERVGAGVIIYRWADVRSLEEAEGVAAFAFPPCTDLTVSGNQDWPRKGLRRLIDSLEVVEACRRLCVASRGLWALENPVGRLSTCWRKPDHYFDPCDYGDPWTKKTCLWVGGGFVMPPKNRVEPTEGSKMHLMPKTDDRANERAETPMGFARAVFRANAPSERMRGVA